MNYIRQVEIRWSDLDPNYHVRHSAYYDFGAYCRLAFLNDHGITPEVMLSHSLGPVLFREECVFKREINFGDRVSIYLTLRQASPDFRKWTMVHELWKNETTLAAVITVDGAWMNTQQRKIIAPPDIFKTAFEAIPKSDDFKII
ncbi:MAG TPA: thioesterase family protein [Parafilimonas sp.]|nr:thioesterase family protein [Parafilimonas sp.]